MNTQNLVTLNSELVKALGIPDSEHMVSLDLQLRPSAYPLVRATYLVRSADAAIAATEVVQCYRLTPLAEPEARHAS